MKTSRVFAVVGVVSSLAIPWVAHAFDSGGQELDNKTYTRPTYPPRAFNDPFVVGACGPAQYPLLAPASSASCLTQDAVAANRSNYVAKILHHATANASGDTTDFLGQTRGIMMCPRAGADVAPTDLSQCTPSTWGTNVVNADPSVGPFAQNATWTKIRRAWSEPTNGEWIGNHSAEHMLITQRAASLAGFDTTSLFNHVFWVHYPVQDKFVASPASTSQYAVGQTFVPASFATMGAHVTRPIYLAELAQLPDASYSVWDWAAGNEICPIAGFDGVDTPGQPKAFSNVGSGKYDINNCHDYSKLLGPLNASHFKPNAQIYWTYYHGLALSRMDQCQTLNAALSPLEQPNIVGNDDNATFNTEEHECEREAMVYEMMAQHFLQDNWSTGHMWQRWGAPDLASIPTAYGNPPGWSNFFLLPENLGARQIVVGQILATAVGMIHGTKAKTDGIFGTLLPTATDDPLSGPFYVDFSNLANNVITNQFFTAPTSPVEWTDDTTIDRGAGDYHWSPDTDSNGAVAISGTDPNYAEQQLRLLSCSAASMHQVYARGPQGHGQIGDLQTIDGVAIDENNLVTDFCWGNYATNASIAGSLGSLFLGRGLNPLTSILLNNIGFTSFMNGVTATLAIASGFAATEPFSGYDPAWLAALDPLLSTEWIQDTVALNTAFQVNAMDDPNGTDNARLIGLDGNPLTMLGVTPNHIIQANPGDPPSYYADVLTPRGNEDTNPNDYLVRRMFWRSHLSETCGEVTASVVESLRAQCIAGAPQGGDPEACTACVEAAEPHVPACGPFPSTPTGGTLLQSKCQALGTDDSAQLPPNWFDPTVRWNIAAAPPFCILPQEMAFEYCTGTVGVTLGSQPSGSSTFADAHDFVVSQTTGTCTDSACLSVEPVSGQPDAPAQLCSTKSRIALAHTEGNSAILQGDPTLPTPEVIFTAFDSTTTVGEQDIGPGSDGTDECVADNDISTDDLLTSTSLTGLPLTGDVAHFSTEISPYLGPVYQAFPVGDYSLGLNFCGTTRRLTLWNRTCADVQAKVPAMSGIESANGDTFFAGLATLDVGTYDYSFQEQIDTLSPTTTENRCIVAEPAQFTRTCNSGVCNSADICEPISHPAPPINYLSWW